MSPAVAPEITVLDGPMGTQLEARGIALPPPLWSASALTTAPALVRELHRAYADAGATVHTANTFRTRRRSSPTWSDLAATAVRLAREAVPADHLVAGSLAPLEDCYRPDLSPPNPAPEHRELARHLADLGVDLLLCETFPHVGEALVAVEEAVATGVPTWVAFTAGFRGDLMTPAEMGRGATEAVRRGAIAVLVNCTPARTTLACVERLADAGVPFGAYANGGEDFRGPDGPARYADLAETWVRAGATLVGSCCGTGPEHVRALSERFRPWRKRA